ncbi:MAG: type II secretion system minor pseudopilin GspI [Gammaproteobacteria bacterium]|nr:type II secretion system minor pseudopilin GspI [Gammaproteobacteria bacterium]
MMLKKKQQGFTLLEVLVAMAIVALGLGAVFMQVNQMLSSSIYLQQKTLGTWVAMNSITEIRLKNEFPAPRETKDNIQMGGINWGYTIRVSKTPVENLRRIDVAVYPADNPDSIIATAAGFRGQVIQRDRGPLMPGTGAPDDADDSQESTVE